MVEGAAFVLSGPEEGEIVAWPVQPEPAARAICCAGKACKPIPASANSSAPANTTRRISINIGRTTPFLDAVGEVTPGVERTHQALKGAPAVNPGINPR